MRSALLEGRYCVPDARSKPLKSRPTILFFNMHMQGFLRHRDCSLKMKIGHYIVHLSLAQPRPMGILQNPNKCKAQVQRHLVKVAANCLNFLGCGVTAAMCFSACHISILSCSDLSLELCPFTWALLTL